MKQINISVILWSVFGGLIYAILTIFAVIHGYEYYAVAILLFGITIMVLSKARQAAFRNGFFAGLAGILCAVWLQALFLNTYFQNNPEYVVAKIPLGLSAQAFSFLTAPIGAAAAGLLVAVVAGSLSWIVQRIK